MNGLDVVDGIFSPESFVFTPEEVTAVLQYSSKVMINAAGDIDTAGDVEMASEFSRKEELMWNQLEAWNETRRKDLRASTMKDKNVLDHLAGLDCLPWERIETWERLYKKHFIETQLEDKMGLDLEEWHTAMDAYVEDVVQDLIPQAAEAAIAFQTESGPTWSDLSMCHAPARAKALLSRWPGRETRHLPLPCDSMVRNLARTWCKYPNAIQEVSDFARVSLLYLDLNRPEVALTSGRFKVLGHLNRPEASPTLGRLKI